MTGTGGVVTLSKPLLGHGRRVPGDAPRKRALPGNTGPTATGPGYGVISAIGSLMSNGSVSSISSALSATNSYCRSPPGPTRSPIRYA